MKHFRTEPGFPLQEALRMTTAPRIAALPEIQTAVWSELAACVLHKTHAWRVGVLATTDGTAADARSIVLREVDVETRSLVFFTDARSPKVRQFDSHPEGALVLWSQQLGWQLRLRVMLSLETSGLAVSSRWARLKMSPAAQDYLSPLPPGSTLDHPAPQRGTREYFAVVTAQVTAMDWLELHAEGHRRALFDAEGGRWVAP
jgi:pyridoxamine 5'-phosphate oxidase